MAFRFFKKMAKIVIDEFNKFVEEEVEYLLSAEKLKFVEITYVVGCSNFTIFVSYDKKNFGSEIEQFIFNIIQKARQSDLFKHNWNVQQPAVEKKNQLRYHFSDSYNIIFTAK